jgi:hypothetical protein
MKDKIKNIIKQKVVEMKRNVLENSNLVENIPTGGGVW